MAEQYLKSKTFLKALAGKAKKIDMEYDWSEYEPHIMQHKKVKAGLFCQLTGSELNKIQSEVEKHMEGKRFKRAKAEFEEMIRKGGELDEESDLEEEGSDDELAGIDEIDFAPSPKRTKKEDPTVPKKDLNAEKPSEKDSSDSKKAETNKKAENESPSKTLEPEKTVNKKINKKQKAKALAAETEEEKAEKANKEAEKKAIEEANPKTEKKKTNKKLKNMNSKKRKIYKEFQNSESKTEGGGKAMIANAIKGSKN